MSIIINFYKYYGEGGNALKKIYLAGGCFWGVEKYISITKGVKETEVGYANGNTENPTYEEVCKDDTGYAEVVKVTYDEEIISLDFLLNFYYDIIDPTSVNRQGGDVGTQYRTGIYYVDEEDEEVIKQSIHNLEEKIGETSVVEIKPLKNYYKAEEYHQHYLDKNPGGYCHIDLDMFEKVTNTDENPQ